MEFTLKMRTETPVVGYGFDATPFAPEISQAWCRVHENGDFQRLMAKSTHNENFGLCIMKPGMAEGTFRYMIAFDHDESKQPDADMETYVVAGGEYAAFHSPTMDDISATFKQIYDEWLPMSEYEYDMDRPTDFEYYYMNGDEVECDIYVPVRIKT